MPQNYKNHVRYYVPHHFIFLPLMTILMVLGIVKATQGGPDELVWIMFAVLSFCILFLAIMMRQHYALNNQNRIVRLEFRLRYWELFGRQSLDDEKKLSFGQIAALRFADDEEFKVLLSKAIRENLPPNEIKKSIRNWQADEMRA